PPTQPVAGYRSSPDARPPERWRPGKSKHGRIARGGSESSDPLPRPISVIVWFWVAGIPSARYWRARGTHRDDDARKRPYGSSEANPISLFECDTLAALAR